MKLLQKVGVGAVALLPLSAFAAIDTAAVVTSIGDMSTALATVGAALIGVAALAVGYKWIKGMLFG
jgi:hypothetical protein